MPNDTVSDQFDVAIDGGNAASSLVTLNSAVTIQTLTVDAGDGLSLSTSSSRITTSGDVTLNGDLILSNGGAVRVGVGASLNGSGTVHLSGSSFLNNLGGTFTMGAGINAHGAGLFGHSLFPSIFNGHITADQSGQTLYVRGNGITNQRHNRSE